MKDFSKERLGDVDIYIADPNEQVRAGIRSTMHAYGMRRVRTFARMADLTNAIKEMAPDLVVVSADLDANVFDTVHDIRHFKLGRNPFIMISLVVDAQTEGAAKRAILSGADDVMVKPIAPGTLLDRVAHLTMHRLPFIATTDYLGPERRKPGDTRPSKIKHLNVVNTLKAKIEGNRLSAADLARAVDSNMQEVMAAQLDSHGLRLGWMCGLILKAYEEKRVTKDVEGHLLTLVGVLEDAALAARTLGEPDLAQVCTNLARQVEDMAQHYDNPTPGQIGTIQKLTRAFDLAKTAKRNPTPAATI